MSIIQEWVYLVQIYNAYSTGTQKTQCVSIYFSRGNPNPTAKFCPDFWSFALQNTTNQERQKDLWAMGQINALATTKKTHQNNIYHVQKKKIVFLGENQQSYARENKIQRDVREQKYHWNLI